MAAVAHSYADPATGCVHLTLRGDDEAFSELVAEAQRTPRAADFGEKLFSYAWYRHRSLFVHEWAHVLQLATYPMLFLRAARAGRLMVGPASHLASNPGPHPLPLRFELHERWRESLMLGTWGFTAEVRDAGIQLTAAKVATVRRGTLTERDLLEEDATVMQYRAEIDSPGKGAPYRNWLRERPRYTRLFSFLSQHVGDDRALRLLPLLVRVAYRTTRPIRALFLGFVAVLSGIADEDADDEALEAELLILVRQELGSITVGVLSMMNPELDDPPGVIEDEAFEELVENCMHLPVAPLARINLSGTEQQRGIATQALVAPWQFFDRRNADIDKRLLDYHPPAITVTLDDPRFPRGSSLMVPSRLLKATPLPDIEGQTLADFTSSAIKARLMWRAVLDGPDGPNTNCPHAKCPYNATGLCRGWISIPATPEDCEFPEFLTYTTRHRLSADGAALEPVP